MRRLLLILLILAATNVMASTGTPGDAGDEQVRASYDEEAVLRSASIRLANTLFPQPAALAQATATTVTVAIPALPAGIHTFIIDAMDLRGNPAAHRYRIDAASDLSIAVDQPGPHGVSRQSRFGLAVRTGAAASCTWRFWTPQGATRNAAQSMGTTDGTLHEATGFAEAHRFAEDELVPVEVRCVAGDGTEAVRIIPVGWREGAARTQAAIWPLPVAGETEVALEATVGDAAGTVPSDCGVDAVGITYRSALQREHEFQYLPAGSIGQTYAVRCAHGSELPQREIAVQHARFPPEISLRLEAPRAPVATTRPIISVRTNVPATCTAVFGGVSTPLGSLSGGLLHQRELTLAQGTHTGRVDCEDQDISGTLAVTLTVDTQGPRVGHTAAPQVCGNEAIVSIQRGDADATHVLISGGGVTALREFRGGESIVLRQGLPVSAGDAVTVRGVDAAGNLGTQDTRTAQAGPADCAPIGIDQQITLLEPAGAQSTEDTFALIATSELPSQCSWQANGRSGNLSTYAGSTHDTSDFPGQAGLSPGEHDITITCTDLADQDTQRTFTIAWRLPAPSITLDASPNPITDPDDPYAAVTVEADQQVRCGYDGGPKTVEYRSAHPFRIPVAYGTGTREVTVACENRHGLTAERSITLREEYPTENIVEPVPIPPTPNATVELRVRTWLPSACEAHVDGRVIALTPNGARSVHTGSVTLPAEGTYAVRYVCREIGGEDAAEENGTIVYDRTPPSLALTTDAYTCGLRELTVRANASDEGSGIGGFAIGFAGTAATAPALPHTLRNLQLTENQTYTLSVTATDRAGNNVTRESQIQAHGKEAGTCDDQPPRSGLLKEESLDGVRVRIVCSDDFGCSDAYRFSTAAPDGACSMTEQRFSRNQSFLLAETSKVCWEVTDINGNIDQDSQLVIVRSYPDHCRDASISGDETGLDCGGSCPVCGDALACMVGSDCASGVCSQNACQQNSCANGIRDGGETDVDCGGLTCGACEAGLACGSRFDCASYNCASGVCAQATCQDSFKNGDETDVDCGGSCDAKCADSKRCAVDGDCQTGVCSGGVCTAERLQQNTPAGRDGFEPSDLPKEEGGILAMLLIVLGLLTTAGGGGYMWWGKLHDVPEASTEFRRDPLTEMQPARPAEKGEDYSQSALREQARRKRRAERMGSRKDLLDSFSGKPKRDVKDDLREFRKGDDEDL